MVIAKIHDEKSEKPIEYYIDDRLKKSLDEKVIPSLLDKDKDCFLVVDGREGGGKSTFAMQIGKYVDPTLNLKRVVFSPDDFREAVLKAKKGQCIIYDEAFTGFSSRSSLGQINRVLVSLTMQMRQKNLFIIIVLPTIFLLDKYIAVFRAKALIHVYENKGTRGYFKLYNYKTKKLLILLGQKTFSYSPKIARTFFRGRFYGRFALGDEKMEKLYRTKKAKALEDSEKTAMTAGQVKFREQRDLLVYLLRKSTKMKYREMSNLFADYDFEVTFQQIAKICTKFGDSSDEKEENEPESGDNKGKTTKKKDLKAEIIDKEPDDDEKDPNLPEKSEIGEESDEIDEESEDFSDFD